MQPLFSLNTWTSRNLQHEQLIPGSVPNYNFAIDSVLPVLQGDKLSHLQTGPMLVPLLSIGMNTIQVTNSNPLFRPFFIAPLATLLHALLCCSQVIATV